MNWHRCVVLFSTLAILIIVDYYIFRKKESLHTALIRALVVGIGSWLIICGSILGDLISGSFGNFVGKFVLYPAGWIAMIEAMPKEPNTPIVKLLFKCGFLGWQVGLGLLEAYTGGSENTAMIALGIGVALAMFEFVESIPAFLKESIDLYRQRWKSELQKGKKQ